MVWPKDSESRPVGPIAWPNPWEWGDLKKYKEGWKGGIASSKKTTESGMNGKESFSKL